MHHFARTTVIGTVVLGTLLVLSGVYIFSFYPRGTVQSDKSNGTYITTTPVQNTETAKTSVECVRSGCSGQLCVDANQADGLVTTCEWNEEYACYDAAICEIQSDGLCGWTLTAELITCVSE